MIYYRHEGGFIRRWRLGLQWWHGPNFHWRTNKHIYSFGFGYGFERQCYTFADYLNAITLDENWTWTKGPW